MQPDSRMWRTFVDIAGKVRATVEPALNGPTHGTTRPEPILTAANNWRVIDAALTDIETAVSNFGEVVFDIWANQHELTLDAKETRTQVAAASLRTALDDRRSLIERQAEDIKLTLHRAGFPARPEPFDSAQEAAIAGYKADLRMVLDSVEEGEKVVDKIGERLSAALADGDSLVVWILATSRWPRDYLESRRFGSEVPLMLDAEIASVLDRLGAADLIEVRSAYAQTKRRHGLTALPALLGAALETTVREYEAWRPQASLSPTAKANVW